MKWAYYNEFNPAAAAWLRELIKAGLIAPGEVDERSIKDVRGDEIREFRQCHFFAGIGGWSYALRLAGWPDERAVWTGSCPCQPFSAAGKGQVDADERHLWPALRERIAERRPAVVFGEQVASKDGRIWLAGVRVDMEALGYGVGAADLCAAGLGAPMVSQRLHWVAEAHSERLEKQHGAPEPVRAKQHGAAGHGGETRRVGQALRDGRAKGWGDYGQNDRNIPAATHKDRLGLAKADRGHEFWWSGPLQVGWNCIEGEVTRGGRKYRAHWRIKPGLSLLADGIPGRVAQLCGFGNAIVPQVAAEFIQAWLETRN